VGVGCYKRYRDGYKSVDKTDKGAKKVPFESIKLDETVQPDDRWVCVYARQ
tara:strand:+ start:756 stop:908 length:153 start_codon:yes stop_codon:yes gene_type:complete